MPAYTVVEYASQPTAVVRGSLAVQDLSAFFGRAFTAVAAALCARGTPPSGQAFAYYPTPPGATIDVEAGFTVTQPVEASGEVVPSQLPAGTLVTTTHVGPYEALGETYQALSQWATEHGWTASGPMWEVYLTDPQIEPDPAKWRTDIFVYVVPSRIPATVG
jgi:effector-binding domain-containing protein